MSDGLQPEICKTSCICKQKSPSSKPSSETLKKRIVYPETQTESIVPLTGLLSETVSALSKMK